MQANGVEFSKFNPQKFSRLFTHIRVRSAVKAVSAYALFLIKLIRQGIHISIVWQSGVKSRVKHSDIWHIWCYFEHSFHSHKVRWVM